ncbi:MAG: metallophosphoesterase, partial [Acidobacteria bacterium]|nr:metallophosphoesterase [Acidobacteriota bacterium]
MSRLAAAGLALAICAPAAAQMPALPPLAGTAAPGAPADPNHFIFVVAGDNRPATETATPTPTIGQIFTEIGAMNPKPPFVALLGDIIYGKDTKNPQLISQEYAAFLQVIQGAGVTVYNAPGNHEMNAKGNAPSATMQAWYKQYTQSLPYGAFTYGNSRFIALDTDDLPGAGDCAGSGAPASGGKGRHGGKKAALAKKAKPEGDLGQEQLSQLAAELQADVGVTNVFIFMHRPIYAQKSSSRLAKGCRDQLKDLFAQYPNVRYVMASHEHLFYQPSTTKPPAPPSYVISGGAGAPLAAGGYYNYLVVTVNGNQVSF